ncbi:MAG: 2,3-diphosphoglycerate-dependent phosphoglycerate mutase [Candidatus Makana argininalis]
MVFNKLVLIRHGESLWNKENKFTGWTDIDLSKNGKKESEKAGEILQNNKFIFDIAYTSMLTRAIHTLWILLYKLNMSWIPVKKSWRLNERHYGYLQGMNKDIAIKKYGIEKIKKWRRGINDVPPKINIHDSRFPGKDKRYLNLNKNEIPLSESLLLTIKRIIPYWKKEILPKIKNGSKIIIVAHGNSIRALIKIIDNLNEAKMLKLNIPTSQPLIYEFDNNLIPIKNYYI